MGLFDNIKNKAADAAKSALGGGNKTVDVVFAKLPDTYEEFIALPQAQLSTPFDTAAMTVLALCFYPQDKELSLKMLDFLRGPKGPLSAYDKSFIKDRFMDADYVPRSFFVGATPANDYTPSEPYTVKVSQNQYSYDNEGYARLWLQSGGADNPRNITLRQAKDGKWCLWEQMILGGIRQPESENPWA